MTWQEAKAVAERHLEHLALPPRLDGLTVQITDYEDEALLRFIKAEEPDITLHGQRMINQAFTRLLRKRGARTLTVPVRAADYFAWLGRFGIADGPSARAQYISWLTCPEPKFSPRPP